MLKVANARSIGRSLADFSKLALPHAAAHGITQTVEKSTLAPTWNLVLVCINAYYRKTIF